MMTPTDTNSARVVLNGQRAIRLPSEQSCELLAAFRVRMRPAVLDAKHDCPGPDHYPARRAQRAVHGPAVLSCPPIPLAPSRFSSTWETPFCPDCWRAPR